jgi:AraC family transcriptional regulator, regulatory protein of adaptative response / methylphosphotriester-DNA alkyltransferase methyltransferase
VSHTPPGGRHLRVAPGGGRHATTRTTTGMQRTSTVHARATLLRDALGVMEADYASDLALRDVARRIATSPRQLQRCFAEHADSDFRSSLARIRMERAAELLTGTSLPVRAVAARVGYRQPGQFAKAFGRRYGEPPTRFRARRSSAAIAA